MGLDDPFPIERCSGRVRSAILDEFHGRCPSIREVASISDAHWLTVPNMGPITLEELRSIAQLILDGTETPLPPGMADNELLSRLDRLQRELALVAGEIRSRVSPPPHSRRLRRQETV